MLRSVIFWRFVMEHVFKPSHFHHDLEPHVAKPIGPTCAQLQINVKTEKEGDKGEVPKGWRMRPWTKTTYWSPHNCHSVASCLALNDRSHTCYNRTDIYQYHTIPSGGITAFAGMRDTFLCEARKAVIPSCRCFISINFLYVAFSPQDMQHILKCFWATCHPPLNKRWILNVYSTNSMAGWVWGVGHWILRSLGCFDHEKITTLDRWTHLAVRAQTCGFWG